MTTATASSRRSDPAGEPAPLPPPLPPVDIPLFRPAISREAAEAAAEVMVSGRLAGGPLVPAFEQALAARLGARHVVAVSDISAALVLALYLSGVRPGDAVIAPTMACTATTMPVANLFARPVWCDVDPLTGMIDPAAIDAAVTDRTRAILAFHWSGDVANLEAIHAAAGRHGLPVVEDASEAFGAELSGRPLGDRGSRFACFSFGPIRHLTTGEGACLVVRDAEDAEAARKLRKYGIDQTTFRTLTGDLNPLSDIPVAGFFCPLPETAAAVGLAQLADTDAALAARREHGRHYSEALAGVAGITTLRRRPDARSAFWTYTLRAANRDGLVAKLRRHGIACQRLHLRNDGYGCFQPAETPLPGTDVFDAENLALPCGPWLTPDGVGRIVDLIRAGW